MVNAWIPAKIFWTYCWWKKSCTTWNLWNHVNKGIFIMSSDAGFLPPTGSPQRYDEAMGPKLPCRWRWASRTQLWLRQRGGSNWKWPLRRGEARHFENKTEEKTNGGKQRPIKLELFSSWCSWFDGHLWGFWHSTRCEKPEHPHDNLKHRNSRSWLGNLFQVSSAAIRSQIELVAFEPAWLIPAFFLTWCLLPKLLCLGLLGLQHLSSNVG